MDSVSQLELGYNPIGPDGAKALCEVLKFHGKVEILKLGWCQVIHNFKMMSMQVIFFQSWSVLVLQIGAKGAEYIADCLKYNTTLQTLDLRANGLGDDVWNSISSVVRNLISTLFFKKLQCNIAFFSPTFL